MKGITKYYICSTIKKNKLLGSTINCPFNLDIRLIIHTKNLKNTGLSNGLVKTFQKTMITITDNNWISTQIGDYGCGLF